MAIACKEDFVKTCSKCRESKPLDQFGRRSNSPDGIDYYCRDCCRERRQQDAERARERSRRWRQENPDRAREGYRRYRQENLEARREADRRYRQENPDRERVRSRERRQHDPEYCREVDRRKRERYRTAVFDHYGWTCACPGCGSVNDITIDHVNGGGKEHRAEIGKDFYGWLVRNGFPDGFQTLCRACNRSKGDGERCRLGHAPDLALSVTSLPSEGKSR